MTTTKPPTVLDRIAVEMRAAIANRDGAATRKLSRGLTLVIRRNERQWTLSIGRQDTEPSINELWITARAFHVPPGCDPVRTSRNGYHLLEIKWLEEEPIQLPPNYQQNPLLAPPPGNY